MLHTKFRENRPAGSGEDFLNIDLVHFKFASYKDMHKTEFRPDPITPELAALVALKHSIEL